MNPILDAGWRVALVWILLLTVAPPTMLWLAFEELRAGVARAPRASHCRR